jgi:hypothetical protein
VTSVKHAGLVFFGISIFLLGCMLNLQAEEPWPKPVEGHQPIAAGEHPRLFFRKSELAALKERAKTPEGQAILKRLRATLNGGDGESMPPAMRKGDIPFGDKSNPIEQPLGCLSLSHPMGYGLLYQLTGDKKYADFAKECMQLMLDGYRDRDGKARYSFRQPTGALRAGPSLAWVVAGYDMCYDGWDPEFRKKVCAAIEGYNEGANCSLKELVVGSRHFPASNHWGMQVGGGALAVLAITGDPEVKNQKAIDELLEVSKKAMIRNVTEGFGDGGYFDEGDGTGSMASHITYLSAIQAWKVSQGLDFISPRPNVRWTALKWFLQTIPQEGKLDKLQSCFPERGGYPHNIWARADGVSGAGYFSIGYESVLPEEKAGIWWWYHQYLKEHDDKAGTPWDTPSPYPHHACLAFINTPFGLEKVNPAEVMPRNVRDSRVDFYAFRNRWQDENDILITFMAKKNKDRFAHGPDKAMKVWHHGKREEWGKIPPDAEFIPAADGSAVIGKGNDWVGIDFSGASGCDGVIVMTSGSGGDATASAGGTTFTFKFLCGAGQSAPKPEAAGDQVKLGKQTVQMKDGKLTFGAWAGPWQGPKAVKAPGK